MLVKTSELEGAALDWAVAPFDPRSEDVIDYRPSSSWGQGGPLIELFEITIEKQGNITWIAGCPSLRAESWVFRRAASPLVAAMRSIVYSEIGEEVDIPEDKL